MKKWVEMEEARALITQCIQQNTHTQMMPLYQATDCIVAKDYMAFIDQPPFSRSPLDGFVLHHEDTLSAHENTPVKLPVVMSIYAGDNASTPLLPGQAARIMTGAMIPEGADCVIRQEDVEVVSDDLLQSENQIKHISCEKVVVTKALKAHDNICDRGEDIRAGALIIKKGEVLTPAHGAVLAGQGIFEVSVFAPISVGVLTTGSELVTDKEALGKVSSGQIYDCNGPFIGMRLGQLGIKSVQTTSKDQPEAIEAEIRKLFENQDIVITTGGVSVGEKDYLPRVCELLGAKILFKGVSMKPGSPMLAASYQSKLLLCLSGNPFAAAATLELMVLPGLLKASGATRIYPQNITATLINDFPKASGKGRRFIRAIKEERGIRVPENHSSGSIYSMVGCNCFIDIPAGSEPLMAGKQVKVVPYLEKDAACLEDSTRKDNVNESRSADTSPAVVCVCGSKNVGKTTLIEKLIPILKEKGYLVGYLKHDGHDFEPDVEGTDSYRMEQAGAKAVAVYSEYRMLLYKETKELTHNIILDQMERLAGEGLDLIIVEGQKASNLPKIEVLRTIAEQGKAVTKGSYMVSTGRAPELVISEHEISKEDRERYPDCRVVALDRLEEVVEWIIQKIVQ